MEAAGQNVEEEAVDELAGLQRQGAMAGGAVLVVVFDAEGDAGPVEAGIAA
ncbi:hypothetical protein Sa4125_11960 [Aureimonas sp. SA4125]|nr:hypothetical protein Sa4125_11960 [Aureimonas sp. SA4125]